MIVAATGLRAEARVIERPNVIAIACGGHGDVLRQRLDAAIAANRPAGLFSIGIAGGLDPALPVGALVIGTAVAGTPTDAGWTARLAAALPDARLASVAGVSIAAFDAAAKAALRARTGAAIVDMESHVVAAVAAAHGLPFAILRAVSDTATDTLPLAARVPLLPTGAPDMARVLAHVARRPWQIPALIGLAANSRTALAALSTALAGNVLDFVY